MSAHAGVILANLQRRRGKLAEYKPEALEAAAEALAAGHELAYRHVPELRVDRSPAHRGEQFRGEEALPLEDILAIGKESETGRRVALAMLRAAVARLEVSDATVSIHDLAAAMTTEDSETAAEFFRALKDGRIDPDERATLVRELDEDIEQKVALRGALVGQVKAPASEPWRSTLSTRVLLHQQRKEAAGE